MVYAWTDQWSVMLSRRRINCQPRAHDGHWEPLAKLFPPFKALPLGDSVLIFIPFIFLIVVNGHGKVNPIVSLTAPGLAVLIAFLDRQPAVLGYGTDRGSGHVLPVLQAQVVLAVQAPAFAAKHDRPAVRALTAIVERHHLAPPVVDAAGWGKEAHAGYLLLSHRSANSPHAIDHVMTVPVTR